MEKFRNEQSTFVLTNLPDTTIDALKRFAIEKLNKKTATAGLIECVETYGRFLSISGGDTNFTIESGNDPELLKDFADKQENSAEQKIKLKTVAFFVPTDTAFILEKFAEKQRTNFHGSLLFFLESGMLMQMAKASGGKILFNEKDITDQVISSEPVRRERG